MEGSNYYLVLLFDYYGHTVKFMQHICEGKYSMKQQLISFARNIRVLSLIEKINFFIVKTKNHKANQRYSLQTNFMFPPESLMYDAYSHCSYEAYDKTGLNDAKMIMKIIRKYCNSNRLTICEFGCGPARIIRHLRSIDSGIDKLVGTDYNIDTINYCKKVIPGVNFIKNNLAPPLDLPDKSIDVLYCISVFTHLSNEMHFKWIEEIRRILKTGGIFIGSFHGDESYDNLLPSEKLLISNGELVTRGKVKEGSRIYTAYHSDQFIIEKLLKDFDFINKENVHFGQTVWCAK